MTDEPRTPDVATPLEFDHHWAWETFVGPQSPAAFLADYAATGCPTPEQAVGAHLAMLADQLPLDEGVLQEIGTALLEHIAAGPLAPEPDPPYV